MKLFPHQQKIVDLNPARHLLAHATGTGKSLVALSLADKNCKTCLVVCPKSLVPKWERDVISDVSGSCRYKVISKEQFKKEIKNLPKYDGVIIDESHYFAGMKSQLSKALYSYCKNHDIAYRWLLTATPYLSTPNNIYTLARHLGHEWNYWSFQNEFFDMIRMGHRMVPKVKKGVEKKLAALVQEIGSTVDMQEAVSQAPEIGEIPEQIFETEFFELTREQKNAISELNDDLFITRWVHSHCIEQGFLYGDGYITDKEFLCLKNNRLKEICFQNNKIMVFCRYTYQLYFLKRYLKSLPHTIFIVDGSSTGKERDSIILNADKSKKAILLVQAQCSSGWEAPSFDIVVFMSLSFSFCDYKQALGRVHRINFLKKNKFIHLVSNGIDKDIFDCIMRKEDFNIAIFEKK